MYLLIKQSNCFTSLVWNWQIAFKPFFCVGWLTFYFFFTCNHDIYVKDLYKTFLWLGFFVFLIFKNGLESLPLKMLLFKLSINKGFFIAWIIIYIWLFGMLPEACKSIVEYMKINSCSNMLTLRCHSFLTRLFLSSCERKYSSLLFTFHRGVIWFNMFKN